MWWLVLLLLVLAVVFGPLFWAMYRVSNMGFADSRGQVVAPEQVPEAVMLRLKDQVEPLMDSGFEYLGMRQESRGGGNYWQTFLTSAGGMVWAVAEEADEPDAGRRVSLVSFGSNGSVAVTTDGERVFGADWPNVLLRRGAFGSALEQAQNHASLLTEQNVPVIAVDPETFLRRYERLSVLGLDSLFERGWLKETKEKSLEVPVLKLPLVGFAWLKHQLAERARTKAGSSWLLEGNLGVTAPESPLEEEMVENPATEEVSAVFDEEEVVAEASDFPANVQVEGDNVENILSEVLGDNELAIERSAVGPLVEPMPIGPTEDSVEEVLQEELTVQEEVAAESEIQISEEELVEEADILLSEEELPEESEVQVHEEETAEAPAIQVSEEEVAEESAAQISEEEMAEEPAIQIPEEDGLARDWALYQRQASQKSWGLLVGRFWRAGAAVYQRIGVFALDGIERWLGSSCCSPGSDGSSCS